MLIMKQVTNSPPPPPLQKTTTHTFLCMFRFVCFYEGRHTFNCYKTLFFLDIKTLCRKSSISFLQLQRNTRLGYLQNCIHDEIMEIGDTHTSKGNIKRDSQKYRKKRKRFIKVAKDTFNLTDFHALFIIPISYQSHKTPKKSQVRKRTEMNPNPHTKETSLHLTETKKQRLHRPEAFQTFKL